MTYRLPYEKLNLTDEQFAVFIYTMIALVTGLGGFLVGVGFF